MSRPLLRIVVLAGVLGVLFLIGLVLVAEGTLTPSSARAWADRELREPIRDLGVAGPLLFVCVGALSSVVLFPGPVMAATSGLLFGTAVGVPTTLGSSLLGAILAFTIARHWAHDAVEELAPPRVQALRAWIGRRGFLAVLYARIAPGVPYNLVNYAAGLTPVRLGAFALATLLGSAPRGFAYTALGGSLGDLSSPEGAIAVGVLIGMAMLGLGLAARERAAGRAERRATAAAPGTGSSSRASRSEGPR